MTTTKCWWARLAVNEYGHWVPTGLTDIEEAQFYIDTLYGPMRVKEWLLL